MRPLAWAYYILGVPGLALTYDELAEENRYLRRQLLIDIDFSNSAQEQQALGIPPLAYKLLRALYDAHGRVVPYDQLFEIVDVETFRVNLCRVRKVLGPDVIRTYWRMGLAITTEGQRVIDDVRASIKVAA
jgi:DNA-binding winged helix-turn-helix (wHTH) protein